MSFFDDDDDETVSASTRQSRTPPRPRPRGPQRSSAYAGPDQHTLMVRRRIAFGVGLVLIILIILLIGGCLKSEKRQALETYSQRVSQILGESAQQVSRPFFSTLSGASSSSPLNVELQVDQLRALAQTQASDAKALSAPGGMQAAQGDLLLALDLRAEGLTKIANLVRTALGGQSSTAVSEIAGDMEMFLASDVIYSQRVAPLISQTLTAGGISAQSPQVTRFLPNLGWLSASTVQERLTGSSSSSSQSGTLAPGTHGSALKGVSIGGSALEVEPTLNRVKSGTNPAITVNVEDAGENSETDVKVNVTVTSAGSTPHKATHVITKTEPGKTVPVDIPVEGVTLEVASKVSVEIVPVRGETNTENNKGSYVVIFEK